jgi:hypothetical protein
LRKIQIICLACLLALAGCMTNMSSYETGNVDSTRKVLIAGEDTAFKRSVVTRVIEKLGTQDWYFKIIGLDQLPTQETEPYGAIMLLGHFWGGRIDERVTSYLKQDPANAKVVLLYTRGAESPLPESAKPDLKVDAVSSASRDDRVETRAGELAALLVKRF